MAKPKTGGAGNAIIPAQDVQNLLREATGLPVSFFVTMEKAKVQQDGSIEAKYTYSTEGPPPAPTTAELLPSGEDHASV